MIKLILILAIVTNANWFQILVVANKCGKNEILTLCPDCNPQTCLTVNQKWDCPKTKCVPACRCKKKYARDNNGDCVPIDYCYKCNRPNEVYACSDPSPQTCETRGQVEDCSDNSEKCERVCRCKNGYYRNKIGECISAADCARCTGNYEYFSCGIPCDNVCGSKYDQDNCNIQNVQCTSQCYCEKNYARATNGTCIPKADCQYECPVNEQYEECPDTICQTMKCSEAGYALSCTSTTDCDGCPGEPGCICSNGYLRNDNGVCIPSSDCPSCGGDRNATSGCGINCGRLCSNYDSKEPVNCIQICKPNGCDCRPEYVYDSNVGRCVLPQDCTPVCTENEVFSYCVNGGCNKKRCSDLNKPDICIDPVECKLGCECAEGYLRNKKGKCVPISECDNCPVNERYEICPSDTCTPRNCSEAGYALECDIRQDGEVCPTRSGCVCKDGFLRNYNGVCVSSSQCPSCGGDNNATLGCGVNCGRLCSNYNSKEPVSCIEVCYADGCDCRKGYVLDSNTNKCVLPQDCTPVCKENEVYSSCTNGGCDRKYCSDLNKPQICIDSVTCEKGCVCAKGYLRNKKGVCVPIDQCDNCPRNEQYRECPSDECVPRTCSDAGFFLDCETRSEGEPCPVQGGCVCTDGYLRDKRGVCIPSGKCPSCGGDRNATLGCGVNCGRLCSNYDSPDPVACIRICYPNACDCRENYVYDSNTRVCVRPKDCTPVCNANEVYSSCVNGGCDKKTCSDLKRPDTCSCPRKCRVGCICANGYLRNNKGVCVPIYECYRS